jgi:hypothetical protein
MVRNGHVQVIREELEEDFHRPNCPASFIFEYENRSDNIGLAEILGNFGSAGS